MAQNEHATERKPVRMTFTKCYNELISELDKDEPNQLQVRLYITKLERLSQQLNILDEKVREWLFANKKDSEYEAEYESVESYRDKYDVAAVKVEYYHKTISVDCSKESVSSSSISKKRNLKLPKIELKKFNGEIREWLGFWGQFSRIHEDANIEAEDKFQYLIQATVKGTRARDIVEGFPATSENYEKVISCLKTRFGRTDMLTEFYIRELLGMVIRNFKSGNNKISTVQLYDQLEAHLRALESIGMTKEKYAAILYPLVESCLPDDMIRAWLRSTFSKIGTTSDTEFYKTKLDQLFAFLKSEVEGEERINLAKSGFRTESNRKGDRISKDEAPVPTASNLFSGEKIKNNLNCVFCNKAHESKDCFNAQKMPLSEKKAILNKKRVCFLCFRTGHRLKYCKVPVRCIVCGSKHSSLMCPELSINRENNEEGKGEENTTVASYCSSGEIILQTLKVQLVIRGRSRVVRALIDSGSQRSYILKKLVNELDIEPVGCEELTQILFGGNVCQKSKHGRYSITVSDLHAKCLKEIVVLDQSKICGNIPKLKPEILAENIKEKGIFLTDIGYDASEIELLIGADFAGEILTGHLCKLECGLLAVETVLGWVVMGRVNGMDCGVNMATLMLHLDQNIGNLWSLDAIGITDPIEKQTEVEVEAAVMNHFERTVKRNEESRYEVCLPWLEENAGIQSNRIMAEKRLISTSARLIEEGKFESYDAVFKEWLQESIIEEVIEEENAEEFFLPHRGVFKSSSTTSVRPVFDASAKVKGRPSLNDCLAKGPNLLELLPTVLMKFRENRIGVISDIKKAFLQISVTKEDRKYLKFLWWENYKEKRIKVFQHCRVVFGVNCSPFLLGAVINYHLSQYGPSLEGVTEKLRKSFYVDNCVTSVESEKELKQFREEAIRIMAEGKFELRGWENTVLGEENIDKDTSTVLGLLWSKGSDTLSCGVNDINLPKGAITRRLILSLTQQVFDPIGMLCPVTLIPKLMLQETWRAKVGWDAAMPEEIENQFRKWANNLTLLSSVKVQRYIIVENAENISLHIFCDASGSAYSSVIFLRSENNRQVMVTFIQAKARVAPLKKTTIPRLELLACSIGARLANSVMEALNRKDVKEYYWTDSSTALHWIKEEDNWGVFVQNRVKEIRRLTSVDDWFHIPGKENPADLPSRGCSAQKLVSSRWWEGPEWLRLREEEWPKSEPTTNEEDITSERRKGINTMLNNEIEELWFLRYFSTYVKCIRLIAWVKRFAFNSRRKAQDRRRGELTVEEFDKAEHYAVRCVQQEVFSEEGRSELKNVGVYKDNEGILRMKTKLTNLEAHENFKFPMVLPSKHQFTERVIRDTHVNNCHAGVNAVLVKLREKIWVLKGRKTIRKVISKCVLCKRYQARRANIVPGVLPQDRVNNDSSVFQVTGVDLAGPLFLRGGQKSWVVLYTCAVYRAVHLELITALSTKAFLLSLRRFISRRGRPKTIYSDNGANFVGSNNLMGTLDWKKIESEAGLKRIDWKFIPPTAAWWGGWWERMVQMIKNLLRRVLGKTSLEYEELMTVLADCEAVINSRPLTYVTDEAGPLRPLTPSMFLQDNCTVGVPELDAIDKEELNKRVKYVQTIRGELRKRFRAEYLANLLQPPMRAKCSEPLKVGDVVLVETENKRIFWPMAKVLEVYPGQDGHVRVVRLKTASGELVRPARRVFTLEIPCAAEEDQCESQPGPLPEGTVAEEQREELEKDEQTGITEKQTTVRTRCGRMIRIPARFI